MTIFDAVLPYATLVFGSLFTYFLSDAATRKASRSQDVRERRANEARLQAVGRDHATKALEVMRVVRERFMTDIGVDGPDKSEWNLFTAAHHIDLIPEPKLRPRLSSAMRAINHPSIISNSGWSHGHPNLLQWEAVSSIVDTLASYVREEPTSDDPSDVLTRLAADQNAAEEEAMEIYREQQEENRGLREKE